MAGMEAFRATDPEFMERWEHFAYEETHSAELDGATRQLAILAALIGCQGTEAFRLVLPAALDGGLTPVMAREVVYQAVDYLGFGRMLPFLSVLNETLTARGVSLPLPGQATTTQENRLERGAQLQAEIFGAQMLEAWKNGPVDYCFIFQGQFFHFCSIHRDREVEDNLPNPVAIRLLFRE